MMPALSLIFGVLLTTVTIAQCATTCLLAQPRPHNAPSTSAISGALHAVLATAKHGPCSGVFPKLPNGSMGNRVHRSTGSLVLEVERANATVHIDHSCVDAFNSIINGCVRSGKYWGGNATSDGVNYAIYNDAYPVNWTPAHASASQSTHPHLKPSVKFVPSSLIRPSVPSHSVLPHRHSNLSSDSLSKSKRLSSSVKTPSKVVLSTHAPNGLASKRPTSVRKPASITAGAAKVPGGKSWRTETISGVTGSPNSYSQTKTTDQNGQPTILPIWFDALGAAVIVLAAAGTAPGAIPPPAGYPPLRIGPDGSASLSQSQPPEQPSASPTSHEQSRLSTSSTPSPHSSSSHRSSSSAAPSASSVDYMISPKDGKSVATKEFTSQLTATFGNALSISQNDLVGVLFWKVPLTPEQKTHYESLSVVSGVYAIDSLEIDNTVANSATQSGTPVPRRRSVRDDDRRGKRQMLEPDTQPNAPSALVDLSTPPPGGLGLGFAQEYYFDPAAGRGSTIYIIDTGANPNNDDFIKMPGTKRWIFADMDPNVAQYKNDRGHHGTCVLSLACGATYGVAKNANVVMVKATSVAGFVNGISLIAKDIKDGPFGKIVVNISIGMKPSDLVALVSGANLLMKLMAETYGVIFVCASGNHGTNPSNKDINLWPAVAASELPMINVGAVYHNGTTGSVSQGGPLLTVTAIGLNIACAHYLLPGTAFQVGSGTSYAAPAVAGLAAYLLSVEKYQFQLHAGGIGALPRNMIALIKSLAYVRPGGTDPVIFNGYDSPLGVAPDDISTDCPSFGYHPKRAACTSRVKSESPAAQSSMAKAIISAASKIGASIEAERASHPSSASTSAPPRPVESAALPPSEKQPGWGPSNPSACIGSPGCDRPGLNGLFQQALSRIQLDAFYTSLTAFSSNFGFFAGMAPTDGALITFQCTKPQDYHDANVSGADIYNAAQMIRSWPCQTCGKHTMTNPSCTVLLGYCKAGDCNDVNHP